MDNARPIFVVLAAAVALVALFAGCAGATAKSKSKAKHLTLFAYNYTERAILDITVDGVWLGWARAHTNSGTAMGLRVPSDRKKQHSINVKWRLSGLYDMETDTYKRMPPEDKSQTVPIKFPYPENPNELILHFYPDGHVEAEMIGEQEDPFDFRRIPIPVGHKAHGRK